LHADRERVRADLESLVSIPSVTGDESAVQDEMTRLMAAAGLDVISFDADPEEMSRDPEWPGSEMPRETLPVAAGTLRGTRPGPRLLLIGHVDVVPPGDLRTWSTPPFQPTVRDEKLFGRGACDMKGGVVAALEAVRMVADAGVDLAGEVVLATIPSEEDGGGGALAAVRAGLTGDMAIITEPTRLEVVVAHAGAITFTLEVPGKAAHASTRREGVSALDILFTVAAALAADEKARNDAESDHLMTAIGLPYPTIIGKVNGGAWSSTVLDGLVVEGRYGVRLGQSPAEAEEELRAAVGAVWAADDFLGGHTINLEISGGRFGSTRIEAGHPLPVGLAAAADRVTGARPALIGVPYGADMRMFVEVGETPTVMYGPGDVRVAHSADEYVALAEVVTCAEVLADWLLSELGAA